METETPTTDKTAQVTSEAEKPKPYQSQRFKDQAEAKAKASWAKTEASEPGKKAEAKEDDISTDKVREILGKKAEGDEKAEEPKEAKTEKEPAIYKEKVKIKVDGQERELTIKEIVAKAQKGEAADKRMQEAATVRKQAGQLIKLLQTDPLAVLKHPALGHKAEKIRELMEAELYEYVKLEAMDPKDRELHETKHKLKMYEEEKQRAAEVAEENEIKALSDKYTVDYQKQIVDALEVGGLPKSPYTVQRMAYYLRQALNKGHRLKAEHVVELVKEDFQRMFSDLYSSADGDKLIALFGEDVAEKINKARMAKLKSSPQRSEVKESNGEDKPKLSWSEWRERNRARNRE